MFKIQNKKSIRVLDFSVCVTDILVPPSADLEFEYWDLEFPRVGEVGKKQPHFSTFQIANVRS